ncbi:Crp/Fnr family transcriptional regulator [Aerococcaceae bacterium DSM 111020]|nr:Crp/Fnr family transcriptional regulator [Aerococcaceae bacterium DSM 111020]
MSQSPQSKVYKYCINTNPLFQSLETEQIQLIKSEIYEKKLNIGDHLYQAGDERQTLYLIQKGAIKLYRLSSDGKEHTISILEAGDFIGERSLFHNTTSNNYAVAIEETTVCCLRQKDFQEIVAKNPPIALELLATLSERLEDTQEHLLSLTGESARNRLLQYLEDQSNKQQTRAVRLPSTKKDLSSYLGMSQETFSRTLTLLTREEIVSQPAPDIIELL